MKINIKVLGNLVEYTKSEEMQLDVDEGTSTTDIKCLVGIPKNMPIGITVNDKLSHEHAIVNNNDKIKFIMLVSGG